MQFQPKTEDELAEAYLFPDGNYSFEVIHAEEKLSRNHNAMIDIRLRVFNGDDTREVRDFLMEQSGFKLRHFCEATGLIDAYESGTLTDLQCHGRCGTCTIGTEKQEGYRPQNKVRDYVVTRESTTCEPVQSLATGARNKPIEDSEIPF